MDSVPICLLLTMLFGMSYQFLEICGPETFLGPDVCRNITCTPTSTAKCPDNAECPNNICVCKAGYSETDDDECIRSCATDSDCDAKSICDLVSLFVPICTCNDDHYREESSEDCLPKLDVGKPCSDDIMCKTDTCDMMFFTCVCDSADGCGVANVVSYGDTCDDDNTLCSVEEFLECTTDEVNGATVETCRCAETYIYNGTACVTDSSSWNVTCDEGPTDSPDISRQLVQVCEFTSAFKMSARVTLQFPVKGRAISKLDLQSASRGDLHFNASLVPCGNGDLFVSIKSPTVDIQLSYPAFHNCDNSQNDIELRIKKGTNGFPPVTLKPGNDSLWEQLKAAGLSDDNLQLSLHHVEGEKFKETTPSSPRVVSAFLQPSGGSGFAECGFEGVNHARYDFEEMFTTTAEIPVGGNVILPRTTDKGFKIQENITFDGPAELVFAYDHASSSDFDKNCSNNYVIIPVTIKLPDRGPPPSCAITSNSQQELVSITKNGMVGFWQHYPNGAWQNGNSDPGIPIAMHRLRSIKRLIKKLFSRRRQYRRFCKRAYKWMQRQLDVKIKVSQKVESDAAIRKLKEQLKDKKLDIKKLRKQIREERAKKGKSGDLDDLKALLTLEVYEKNLLKKKKQTLKVLSKKPNTYSICTSVRDIIALLKKFSKNEGSWTFEDQLNVGFNITYIEEILEERSDPPTNHLRSLLQNLTQFNSLRNKTSKEYASAGLPYFHHTGCASDSEATFLMSIADSCNTSREDMQRVDLCEELVVPYFVARGGGAVFFKDIKKQLKKDKKPGQEDIKPWCPGEKPDGVPIPFNSWHSRMSRVTNNGMIQTTRFDWFTSSVKWSTIGVCQCNGDTCGDGQRRYSTDMTSPSPLRNHPPSRHATTTKNPKGKAKN